MNAEINDTEIHPVTRKERLSSIFTDAIARQAKEIVFTYAEGEFPNATRAQEVVRHTAKLTYQQAIGCTYALTSRYISTYVDKERPRTVVVRVKYDEYRIDKKPKMTNAEKLAKDTARLSEIMADSAKDGCRQCSLHGLGVCSMCHSPLEIEDWLEREVEEE